MKSPSTAKFPNILEWSIVKNKFYVAVQAYVDAQNAFGATTRSDFAFIYKVDTSDIVYAVFDGEVIADNGYVKTEELVFHLLGEDSTKKVQVESTKQELLENNNVFDDDYYYDDTENDWIISDSPEIDDYDDTAEEPVKDLDGIDDYYDNGGMLPHDGEGFADWEGLNDWGDFDSDDIVEEPVRDLDGIVDYVADMPADVVEDRD